MPWLAIMNFVDFVEIFIPIAFALANLEAIELGAGLLVFLEAFHQVLGGAWNQEVGNPKHVGIHIAILVVV